MLHKGAQRFTKFNRKEHQKLYKLNTATEH